MKSPRDLYEHLNKHLVGQTEAKKVISVAIFKHYLRTKDLPIDQNQVLDTSNSGIDTSKCDIAKSNVLIIGESGSGKTLMAKTVAKFVDVPFAIGDCSTLTQSGYIGSDPSDVLRALIIDANNDVKKAERGIVFLDEIDKIASRQTLSRDVAGRGVQEELLCMLEGSKTKVELRKDHHVNLDTSNILFVASGAFIGLEDIIRIRQSANHTPKSSSSLLMDVTTEDLFKFGLIPELVGRLPIIVTLESITYEILVELLTKPKDSIVTQFKELFKSWEIQLDFEPEAIEAIAKQAIERQTGARGARAVIEKVLLQASFDAPDSDICQVTVTKKAALELGPCKYLFKSSEVKIKQEPMSGVIDNENASILGA